MSGSGTAVPAYGALKKKKTTIESRSQTHKTPNAAGVQPAGWRRPLALSNSAFNKQRI